MIDWLRRRIAGGGATMRDGISIGGKWTVTVFDAERLRRRWPDWDRLSKQQQIRRLRASEMVPLREHTTTNQVSLDHRENFATYIDPNGSATDIDASHVALGDGGGSAQVNANSLGNQVYQEAVDSTTNNGTSLDTTTLIGQSEGNGSTFNEAALLHNASSTYLNRAIVTEEDKTDGIEIQVTGTLFYDGG